MTTDTTFPEGDVRRAWPETDWYPEQLATAERLKPLATDERSLSQIALAYVLSRPGVSTTIPGAKTPQQVEQNAAAAGVRLSDDDLRTIDEAAPPPGA
jgi:aryl-alcohol dehydrogenase-like predicted oxidoreductase